MEFIIFFLMVLVVILFPIALRLLANMNNVLGTIMRGLWILMIAFYELITRIPFVGLIFGVCVTYMRFVDRTFGKPSKN